MDFIGLKRLDFLQLCGISAGNMKKELLYFDKIIIDVHDYNRYQNIYYGEFDSVFNEIDYLNKIGLVDIIHTARELGGLAGRTKNFLIADLVVNKYIEKKEELMEEESIINNGIFNQEHIHSKFSFLNFLSRCYCNWLNLNGHIQYKPIFNPVGLYYEKNFLTDEKTVEKDVFQLVLEKFPIPSENTSWEQIIDFKNDSEIQLYRLGLKNWISDIGKSNYHPLEIEQKLEYLKKSYEDRMNKEKMKYNVGTIELITTTTLEVLENIVKLNWSKAAKALFNLKRRKVDLLLGETKAPGRDIAYICKVQEKF